MSYRVDQESCTGCGKCKEVCPAEAIEFESVIATIDEYQCIRCGICQVQCPEDAVRYEKDPLQQSFPFISPAYEMDMGSI